MYDGFSYDGAALTKRSVVLSFTSNGFTLVYTNGAPNPKKSLSWVKSSPFLNEPAPRLKLIAPIYPLNPFIASLPT